MKIPYSFDVGQGATFRMDKFTINSTSVSELDSWIITPADLDSSGRLLINYKYTNTSGTMSIKYVKISLVFSGVKGSTSYTIRTDDDTLHGRDSISGSKYITIGLTDNRETVSIKVVAQPYNSDTKKTNTKVIDGLSWAYEMDKPTVTSFTASRTSTTSTTVQYKIKGSRISSTVGSYSLVLEWSKDSWTTKGTVPLTDYIGSFLSSSGYTGTLTGVGINEHIDLRIIFRNLYEVSSRELSISQASACLHLAGNLMGGVCFGGYSSSTSTHQMTESYYPGVFYKGVIAPLLAAETKIGPYDRNFAGATLNEDVYAISFYVQKAVKANTQTDFVLCSMPGVKRLIFVQGSYNRATKSGETGQYSFPLSGGWMSSTVHVITRFLSSNDTITASVTDSSASSLATIVGTAYYTKSSGG